jgi:hypothetical protein
MQGVVAAKARFSPLPRALCGFFAPDLTMVAPPSYLLEQFQEKCAVVFLEPRQNKYIERLRDSLKR